MNRDSGIIEVEGKLDNPRLTFNGSNNIPN